MAETGTGAGAGTGTRRPVGGRDIWGGQQSEGIRQYRSSALVCYTVVVISYSSLSILDSVYGQRGECGYRSTSTAES